MRLRRSRGLALVATVLASVLAISACGSGSGPDPNAAATKATPFTIVTFPGEVYVLDEVAEKQGFFRENGLEVKFLSPASGASAANQFFIGGSIQAWPGNPSPVLADAGKGYDVALAGLLQGWIPWALQVRADSDLASVQGGYLDKMRALKGRSVGVPGIGSLVHQLIVSALREAGVGEEEVNFVGVGLTDAGIASLQKKRIDAYSTFSFVQAKQVQDDAKAAELLALTSPEAPETIRSFANWAFSMTGKFAKENPAAAEGYAKAMRQAYEWTKRNPEAAAKIVSDRDFKGERIDELTAAIKTLMAIQQEPDLKVNKGILEAEITALQNVDALPAGTDKFRYEDLVPQFARQ